MSLYSSGRKSDASLEEESISALQEKLASANKELDVERARFKAACDSGNQARVMPALQSKQAVMQEVLRLQRALHNMGVSQTTEDDKPETLDRSRQEGVCFPHGGY